MLYLRISLLALATAGTAAAQCPSSLSFLSGMPTGVSLEDNMAVPFAPSQVYMTSAGFSQLAPPPAPTTASGIHFRLDDILSACSTSDLDVNAMSLGQDWILIDDVTGVIEIPPNRWAALSFSVSKTSIGQPGSVIAREAGAPEGPGADIFTYAFRGSALPAELTEQTQRSHDSREIDLGDGSVDQREIDAIDQYMPLYQLDAPLASMLPDRPSIYFTLTAASAATAPAIWYGGQTQSGATILRVIWSPTTNSWSCPRVWKHHWEIGLPAAVDIDALAIDIDQDRIIFSTTAASNRDQIEFVNCTTDAPFPQPVKEEDGMNPPKNVSEKIKLDPDDDVDGVCGIDPSVRRRLGAPTLENAMFFAVGTPVPPVFPPADTLQASAFRIDTPGGPALYSQLVGWPPVTGQGRGLALLTFSPPAVLSPLLSIGGGFRNDVMPAFCGDPYEQVFFFPPVWVQQTPILEWDLRWFVADSNLIELRDAHPLRVRL